MNLKKLGYGFFALILAIFTSCSGPSSSKDITAFTLRSQVGATVITNIDATKGTIAVTMPYGTDVTTLTPTITVSPETSVSPKSGVAQDFTHSVVYTVMAEDSSTKTYTVTVTVAEAPSFAFNILTSAPSETFTLPLTHTGTYNFTVNWGDGNSNTITVYNDANATHIYAAAGTYTLTMLGTCTEFDFNINPTDAHKVTAVNAFKDLGFSLLRFSGCDNLVSIASNMNVLTHLNTAERMFIGCSSLRAIPAGSFDGSTGITDFSWIFYNCTSLASIPSGLFDHNTAAITFSLAFYNCSSLTSIPSGLFRHNTAAINFDYAFSECTNVQLVADIFYPTGDCGTRFLDQTVDFSDMFYISSFTGTQGVAPDLWTCNFGSATPFTSQAYGGANSSASLANYSSIPGTWE